MSLSIYLYFDGNCGEAFDHYKTVFGAEELCRQTFDDAREGAFENDEPNRIMHTTLNIGSTMLMGSDRPSSCVEAINLGNNYAVMYRPTSTADAVSRFEKLADGGTITMPLQETFWGSYFGMCTDRFGIHWKFNLPMEQQATQ